MIIQCRFDYVNSIKTITYSRYTDMPQSSPFEYTSFLVAIISILSQSVYIKVRKSIGFLPLNLL